MIYCINYKCDGDINDSFKIKWTVEEITDFADDVKTQLSIENKKYDSLIFILTCHGDSDGVILDSDCEEYSLFDIYSLFNGKNFQSFAHCPKLFLHDCCRGSLKSKPIAIKLGINNHSQLNEIIISPKGKLDDSDDDDENQDCQDLKEQNLNIHSEANFFFVFANPDGYAAFDGGNNGGYLIQALYKVFEKKEIINKTLNSIILHTAETVKKMAGSKSMQHLQTVSNVHYSIKFAPKHE